MIDSRIFEGLNPLDHCAAFSYSALTLATTCRIALENDTSGIREIDKIAAVANSLEIVEALMSVVIDGAERMERKLECGSFKKGGAA